ncbi:hypothetical protein BLS_005510 [Venturia inaequalis]|uniref:Uncharacterized protein n=1 Tax=Venturia inaequalis TaxID=5025 RepID=A0A8H3YT47_VENIN|nr:hypothetical protein BLS_005510 [Venturia inaequalis]
MNPYGPRIAGAAQPYQSFLAADMNMHGLKQLLVLALAGSGLACEHHAYSVKEPAIMFSTTGVTEPLGVTVTFRVSGPLVGKINMGVHVN